MFNQSQGINWLQEPWDRTASGSYLLIDLEPTPSSLPHLLPLPRGGLRTQRLLLLNSQNTKILLNTFHGKIGVIHSIYPSKGDCPQWFFFLFFFWQVFVTSILFLWRLPQWLSGKESACNAGATGDAGSIPGSGDPLEEGMATHSSILAWGIPWTEKPGGLQSMGFQRVRHD